MRQRGLASWMCACRLQEGGEDNTFCSYPRSISSPCRRGEFSGSGLTRAIIASYIEKAMTDLRFTIWDLGLCEVVHDEVGGGRVS